MREAIYNIIRRTEPGEDNKLSKYYDIFIMLTALLSVTPLMFKTSNPILDKLDIVTVYILFTDYIFRWITHDYEEKKSSKWSFIRYPFTFFAIIDLLSLLPSLGLISHSLVKSFRVLRMLRIFKLLHYSRSFVYISNVFQKERKTLLSVLIIALAYIYVSALSMFALEPDTFDNFFEALYWATTALTTVGYGDVYPVSVIGRFISMISSLFGIAVIALPAGIVTAGFVEEINQDKAKIEAAKKQEIDIEEAEREQ